MTNRESSSGSAPTPPRSEKGSPDSEKTKARKPSPTKAERKSVFHVGRTLWARYVSGWISSVFVHLIILVLLAFFTLPPAATDRLRDLFSSADQKVEELEDFDDEKEIDLDLDTPLSDEFLDVEETAETTPESVAPIDDMAGAAVKVDLSELGFEKAPKSDLMSAVGAFGDQELGGRGEKARKALVARGGGNKASEAAVAAGLEWLAAHQMPDGGWSFRMDLHPKCKGQCRNPGVKLAEARIAATGLALMPFLGAGQTQKKGKYKKVVNAGLTYLVSRMGPKGEFTEKGGRMYSHGIASIVLCEAFAMTKDNRLFEPAQRSINYICQAQDPIGGGWRYGFRKPGDTSVVGWQLMALKSANLGYLKVPAVTIQKTIKFLDFVQAEGGAYYGYTEPAKGRPATTAVGLLCRMYLGWRPDDPGLSKGVKWIAKKGPSKKNIYFNYYATQVLHHWGDELWDDWNRKMRDQLVATQAREGHERGSWYIDGGSGQEDAGRLYCTSLNTMILEIYYRYLPLYQKESTTTEFTVE